ncbi:MAG: hypothetical protein U1E21_24135 [Reyranellaceae bacterium]
MIKKALPVVIAALAGTVAETGDAHAQAGLLSHRKDLAPITLASGKPLAAAPYELEAGKYYRIAIESDGSAELGVSGADFFRNVWVNEVVINEIEVRPLGVDSIEFDDEGKATISFVPIRPGTFVLRVPGTTSESQQAVFNVK